MKARRHLRRRVALGVFLIAYSTTIVTGCGGGSGSSSADGAAELAHQHELAQARRQGARAARQAARIRDLEQEVHAVRKDSRTREAQAGHPASGSVPVAVPEAEEISGDWPGGSGYTAILASVSSEGEASSIQAEATGKGLDAGILFSSDYSSLRPGYWVVFSGVFQGSGGAEARAEHARELAYSEAYPRFVSP